MAITFFGQVGIPTDNGTSATSPLTFSNPPIASMQTGDLVIVYLYARNAAATFTNSVTGGQTWNSSTVLQGGGPVLSSQVFWCRFNGTWTAGPAFTFSSTTNTNAIMNVFRPTSTAHDWGIDPNGLGAGIFLEAFAAASPVVLGAFGITTEHASTVSFAIWSTDDDNTWGTLTGSGWSKTSMSAQFRNTSGSDTSSSYAYNIKTTLGASVPNPGQSQATLGNDPGITGAVIFYEFLPVAAIPNKIVQVKQAVKRASTY